MERLKFRVRRSKYMIKRICLDVDDDMLHFYIIAYMRLIDREHFSFEGNTRVEALEEFCIAAVIIFFLHNWLSVLVNVKCCIHLR